MADLSNKTLALLLLVAISISIFGTLNTLSRFGETGITGRVVSDNITGKTNFTISSQLSIRFVQNVVDFGSGYVNGSHTTCVMGTNSTQVAPGDTMHAASGCVDFNRPSGNLTIENDGNLLANVSLNFTRNATDLIGGTNPSFKYKVINSEASSCGNIRNGSSFIEVDGIADYKETSISGVRICDTLEFDNAGDTVEVGFWLTVPQDSLQGQREVTLWAIACDNEDC